MRSTWCAAACAALLAFPCAGDEWLTSMSAGKKAAEQSGKAILYVTTWSPGT